MIQAHHIFILDTSHRPVAVLTILTFGSFGLKCDFDCRTLIALVNPRDSGGPPSNDAQNQPLGQNVSADVWG